jgi:uncharacterized membrane protein
MIRSVSIILVALLLVSTFCDTAMACPTCKSALHSGLALGYAISILFMMLMPFVIFSFWIVTIVRLRANSTDDHLAHQTTTSTKKAATKS